MIMFKVAREVVVVHGGGSCMTCEGQVVIVIKFVVVMIPSLTSNNIPLYQCT